MKIRMVEERTGPRWDNRAWPPVGGEFYVDDGEGAAICAHGWAVPVPEDPVEVPEAAQKVLEETRTSQPATAAAKPAAAKAAAAKPSTAKPQAGKPS